VALDGPRSNGLPVLLAPLQVNVDHLAQGLGGRALVAAGQHPGLEPGLSQLGLLAAALDLAADLPLMAYHRVNACVGDHLPAVAAGDASRLASRSDNHEIGNIVDPADQPSARETCSDLEPEGGFEPPTCRLRGRREPIAKGRPDKEPLVRRDKR